jgi:serine/threonine protein kinase
VTYNAVLYSRKDSVWKLADFGFTSEATSRSLVSSKDGRGTPSYRAPELLAYDAPSFNKKVDIWSMGCIMYELALRKRAFGNDYATMEYRMEYRVHQKAIPVILDETFGEQCKEPIVTNITNMLQMEPAKRPSATDLVEEFSRQLQVTQLQPHHNVHVLEDFHPVPPALLPRDDPQFQTQVWPILHVQQDTVRTTPDATSNIIRSVTSPIIRSDSNTLKAVNHIPRTPNPVHAPPLRTTANIQAVQSSSPITPVQVQSAQSKY